MRRGGSVGHETRVNRRQQTGEWEEGENKIRQGRDALTMIDLMTLNFISEGKNK